MIVKQAAPQNSANKNGYPCTPEVKEFVEVAGSRLRDGELGCFQRGGDLDDSGWILSSASKAAFSFTLESEVNAFFDKVDTLVGTVTINPPTKARDFRDELKKARDTAIESLKVKHCLDSFL